MGAYVGRLGTISITATSSGHVSYVDSWSLNASIGTAEITAFTDTARAYAQTLRDATATITMTMDRSDTDQVTLFDQFEDATLGALTVRLYPDDTEFWHGYALLTGMTVNSNVADKVSVSMNLQFTGALNYFTSGTTVSA